MEITVIIPVYNAEKYIEQCIDSCFIQPEVREVVVVDDCSTDGTYEILKQLTQIYSCLRVFYNDSNIGPGASRNIGYQYATCKYISFLDADDYYLEGRFKKTKELFQADPSIKLVYSTLQNFSITKGNELILKGKIPASKPKSTLTLGNYLMSLFEFSIITVVFKRSIFETNKLFDPQLILGEDLDFIIKCLYQFKVAFADDQTDTKIMRRLHHANITNKNEQTHVKARHYLFNKWYQHDLSKPFDRNELYGIIKLKTIYYLQETIPLINKHPLKWWFYSKIYFAYFLLTKPMRRSK